MYAGDLIGGSDASNSVVAIMRPGEWIGEEEVSEGHVALAIGSPWGCAFAIKGAPEELRSLLHQALKALGQDAPAR